MKPKKNPNADLKKRTGLFHRACFGYFRQPIRSKLSFCR